MARHNVYRFHAELADYEPKIWRRFEINGEKSVAELGYALMLMFEMRGSHLFLFTENVEDTLLADLRGAHTEAEIKDVWDEDFMSLLAKNHVYALSSHDMELGDDERLIKADKIKLQGISKAPGFSLTFEYDFGDGWKVDLALEEFERRGVGLAYQPKVLDGAGYGIIENVGGARGLHELAKALKKGSGEEYDQFCEWLGGATLDLEAFDIDDLNYRLQRLTRVYKNIYERHSPPADKTLSLLNRAYKGQGSRGY
ncbi:MAG: plasmid pRiA4b ORF-3 family protein [Deltaproteobacteria bacterium]|jgi:hypothetical protein|nr:plasmid pRiA4b ORF-3 family protein [Deltaproteobacteria bacterium]